MGKNLYIADWHYGHNNAIAFDNRPFVSVDEMNKALIDNWNRVTCDDDTVFVVGDMFWCSTPTAISVLDKLAGRKVLVRGNHDKCKGDKFKSRFECITDYLELYDSDRHVVLCHYPIVCFKNHFYGWYHLYGHVHNSFEAHMMEHNKMMMQDLYDHPCRMYNVGCMMPWIDYTPRTLSEIISYTSD